MWPDRLPRVGRPAVDLGALLHRVPAAPPQRSLFSERVLVAGQLVPGRRGSGFCVGPGCGWCGSSRPRVSDTSEDPAGLPRGTDSRGGVLRRSVRPFPVRAGAGGEQGGLCYI